MASKPAKVVNTGKTSEAFFVEQVEAQGGAVFRLRDKADLFGLNKRNVAAFGQPSDFFVASPNGAFLAEVKSSNNKTSFSLSCFTPAQKVAIVKAHRAHSGKFYRIYIHNMLEDRWYIMNASDVVFAIRDGIKSIKWQNLKPLRYWIS